MLFNSFPFAAFFLIVFLLYWFVFNRTKNLQNAFLLFSSYFFYGYFSWKYALLLIAISIFNYAVALLIQRKSSPMLRKLIFFTGLLVNIGILANFKYFNFFQQEFIKFISLFGFHANFTTLYLILPLGISFYTFLALSYLIDVYQKKLTAVKNPIEVLLSFSFFPIILAGPIHRPKDLIRQMQSDKVFKYAQATDGLRQILWGVFMKMIIADQCGSYVDIVFANPVTQTGSALLFGVLMFTIQIYSDFAGYSNMAIGIGKLLGFDIMQNFAYPYFARDIREFWKRWNISLTTWFRDYVFLPVAFSVSKKLKSEKFLGIKSELVIYASGITVTWILTGLWHGANYSFIVWGLIHGIMLFSYHLISKPRKKILKKLGIRNNSRGFVVAETLFTLGIVMIAWMFFRAGSLPSAYTILSRIFTTTIFTTTNLNLIPEIFPLLAFILLFFIIEWSGRNHEYGIAGFGLKWPRFFRWAVYFSLILAVFLFSAEKQQFIYFQF